MPKVNVQALRWGLVVVNLLALTLVGFAAYYLFLGDQGELKIQLADASEFEPEDPKQAGNTQQRMRMVVSVLTDERPPPPAPKPQVEPREELRDTGPLDNFIYYGGIMGPEPMAVVAEKQTVGASRPTRVRQTRRPSSSKARKSRRPQVPKTRRLWEGEEFQQCLIEEIHANEIIYSKGSQRYILKKQKETTSLEDLGEELLLKGTQEEDGLTSGRPTELEYPGSIVRESSDKAPASVRPRPDPRAGRGRPSAEELKKLQETMKQVEKSNPKAAEELRRKLGDGMNRRGGNQ